MTRIISPQRLAMTGRGIKLSKRSLPAASTRTDGESASHNVSNLGEVSQPRSFSFKCEMPPSANSIWRAVNGRVIKSATYRKWVESAGQLLAFTVRPAIISGLIPFTKPVEVLLAFPKGHASSDLDNRIKPALDLLQAAGVLKNDNIVHDLRARWKPKTYQDQVQVLVTVSELT